MQTIILPSLNFSSKGKMNNYLREYLFHLKEDGELDWLVYNIGIEQGWHPLRLPFSRELEGKNKQKKGEREFGIDLSFLAGKDRDELIIVVLKAVKLNTRNWKKDSGFREDLEEAMDVQLQNPQYQTVEKVRIITAFNKDEEKNGVESYERFANAHNMNSTRGPGNIVPVSHEKWNLEILHSLVEANLFNPDLLPRNIASGLHYLTSQFQDFSFGTTEWDRITVPTWKQSFGSILEMKKVPLAKKIRLITVACEILGKSLNQEGIVNPGFLDIVEFAVVKIFHRAQDKEKELEVAYQSIFSMYDSYLEIYIEQNRQVFLTPDGFSFNSFFGLSYVSSTYRAFWNVSRLCILILVFEQKYHGEKKEERKKEIGKKISGLYTIVVSALQNEAALYRPLVDLNHRDLFFIWLVLFKIGGVEDATNWIRNQVNTLANRRQPRSLVPIPFMEGYSRWELVAEYAATGKKPLTYCDDTTYLVSMLMEMACALPDGDRTEILRTILDDIAFPGAENQKPLKLVRWKQIDDWSASYLGESHRKLGHVIPVTFEAQDTDRRIEEFCLDLEEQMENLPEIKLHGVLIPIFFLASLKQDSPIPTGCWRILVKGQLEIHKANTITG